MPTQKHLFQSPLNKNEYTLEVDFMHSWDKSLTEDYTVRVILPEGAHNIKLELPFHVTGSEITTEKYFGTLDFYGRPTIRIVKPNAVHDICDGLIRVKYEFDSNTMMIEPI
jgi:oligosaccharyltransferase complex subunit alpha (ribophorin I)